MSNTNPTFVVTNRCRLSYVHLTQPYANQPGAEAKYSTTVLLPKSDADTKRRIDAAIEAAAQLGAANKWQGRPPVFAVPVYDGDGVRPSDGMPFGPECKGHWVFSANSKMKPEVVDANLNPILDATQIYSGMYARVSVNFFPYNAAGKKGVGCGLGNVQKLEDGEALGGGRTSAADDFGAFETPAQGYGQPAYQQPTAAYQQPAQGYGQPAYQQPTAAYQAPAYGVGGVDPITGLPVG